MNRESRKLTYENTTNFHRISIFHLWTWRYGSWYWPLAKGNTKALTFCCCCSYWQCLNKQSLVPPCEGCFEFSRTNLWSLWFFFSAFRQEEESEEEPKLKYERLSNGVTEILQKGAASCMTVHDKVRESQFLGNVRVLLPSKGAFVLFFFLLVLFLFIRRQEPKVFYVSIHMYYTHWGLSNRVYTGFMTKLSLKWFLETIT